MQFHHNINSLRAVAVLAVILYHFKVAGFTGGFVGVDVFFVISGYLMTAIIARGVETGHFSFMAFYAARARRIIPALAVLCVALGLFGYAVLPLDDYRELLRSIKSSLLFTSNHTFADGGDYFDTPLHENWLLHTWSLSVEWQFYLLYPLILVGLAKALGRARTRLGLLCLGAASLLLSVFYTASQPTAAFFLLPTRAWEMIAGGLMFYYPLHLKGRARVTVEAAGLLLIAVSLLVFSAESLWPSYGAMLPVLGAALVIQANADSPFSRNRILQFLGTTSYSAYLWHWPVVVLLYTSGLLQDAVAVTCGILLSLSLGALSYRLVESRRSKTGRPLSGLLKHAGVAVGVIGLAAGVGSLAKHHPEWRPDVDAGQPDYASRLYTQQCTDNPYDAVECTLGSGEVSAILLGDSHAQATAGAYMQDASGAALGWSRAGCPTLRHFEMQDKDFERKCKAFNADKFTRLAQDYPGVPLILFSRAGLYADQRRANRFSVQFEAQSPLDDAQYDKAFVEEYTATVCALTQNRPVYIVRPVPEMPFSVYKALNLQARLLGTHTDISAPLVAYNARNRLANTAIDQAAASCDAKVLDPVPYLCPDGQCMGSQGGVPLYWDDNHLVDAGNVQLRGLFNAVTKTQ